MSVEIALTKGFVAIVDDCDGDLAQFKWFAYRTGYAYRNVGKRGEQKRISLHGLILERILGRPLEKTEFPDHVDNDSTNCRRGNLRLATMNQNNQNRGLPRTNKSGLKGAHWHANAGKWAAVIRANNKSLWLGTFTVLIDAHRAYCIAALKHCGDFANFGANSPFSGWTLKDFESSQVNS